MVHIYARIHLQITYTESVQYSLLHAFFRDHDEEFSVIDAAKKLNEVQSMKGLGRFFKQVAQSARSGKKGGDVDDFLGCVTVSMHVSQQSEDLNLDKPVSKSSQKI